MQPHIVLNVDHIYSRAILIVAFWSVLLFVQKKTRESYPWKIVVLFILDVFNLTYNL